MGTMGLALPWKARIASAPRGVAAEGGPVVASAVRLSSNPARAGKWSTRVDGSEHVTGGPMRVAGEAANEDAALAAACRSGDLRAYERLYTLHCAKMKNLARNVLGSPVDAEDAVQETFLKVQRSIATFRGQSSFVTWTYRILINTCYDARRSRLRKKEVTTNDESEETPRIEPRAPGAHPSLRMALERALGKLTRHQRDVFVLYEVEGFRHAEIAGMLDITEAASKNTLFQAKKNLREMLEPPRSSSAEA
ncbi:MAG TPA: RNA polymerase sigma factor [Candidatus Acidoferrum sp.]|nr:RNA polymerase sigma factor [Candidatus Acidoferrum sp.]